ncbi:lipoyl(octanoyl) transferase LipB [Bartonella sp. HY406]|nr:lipoyl(octanoyl) transferase LipB [Bartonella sp. HY406]UXN04750.1 lipoyl(octanoyl) transferase LipB [Bartonella sp. HY406]
MRPSFRNDIKYSFKPQIDNAPVEWRIESGLTDYQFALDFMQKRAEAIRSDNARELIWLVEHPPLYTAGTSANINDLIAPDRFPVYDAGRGGEYTYHGPGQRIVYIMLDLKKRREDIRAFVAAIEQWIIDTLAEFNIKGERREDRVGVWVVRPERPSTIIGQPAEDKIAAIGIRLKKWVSFHGLAINVEPDLTHYSGIVPCGIANHGVTSLVDLGLPVTMDDVDNALAKTFAEIFGDIDKQ